MFHSLFEWFRINYTELLGAILGILYVFLSIRQNIYTWPTGILTSLLYIFVFFRSGIYAAMSLQVYYVIISIYGWYYWLKGKNNKIESKVPVKHVNKQLWFKIGLIFLIIYTIIFFILSKYSDSNVPVLDSITTSLSIIATWMLARKYLENWIIWIIADILSAGLYFFKNLWPTIILFVVYTVMAFAGYFEWKKDLNTEFEKEA